MIEIQMNNNHYPGNLSLYNNITNYYNSMVRDDLKK